MVRKTLIAAGATATMSAGIGMALIGPPALAQSPLCEKRVEAVEGEFGDMLSDPGYGSAQLVLRNLRNAALRLETQRMDDACMETVEALEAAVAAYRAAGPDPDAEIVPAPELSGIDERALSFGDAGIDTARIRGADVYNYDNDYLGEVSDVVVSAARPTHVIVGEGSLFDTGPTAAIPVSKMRWDPEWEAFFVPITSEALENAPRYSTAGGNWNSDENDRYYDELLD